MDTRERFEREQFEAWHKWAGYSEDYRETRWPAWYAAAETFAKRIAELEAENKTLRAAQKACEACDEGLSAESEVIRAERDALKAAIATAYGHLWHVNNEPFAPVPIYTPEKAAYAARKVLRDLLTSEQRGDAINATQHVWGSSADAAKEK